MSNGDGDRDGDRCCRNGVETGTGIAVMGWGWGQVRENGWGMETNCCPHAALYYNVKS